MGTVLRDVSAVVICVPVEVEGGVAGLQMRGQTECRTPVME